MVMYNLTSWEDQPIQYPACHSILHEGVRRYLAFEDAYFSVPGRSKQALGREFIECSAFTLVMISQ